MSYGMGVTKVVSAANANLNQAANTVLLTYVASKPCVIQRFGAVANSANGILTAARLKLRRVPITTGTAADITGTVLNPGGTTGRGVLVYKDAPERVEITAGDHVTIAVSTDAGATCTADVWLEVVELPFAGYLVPSTAVKSA